MWLLATMIPTRHQTNYSTRVAIYCAIVLGLCVSSLCVGCKRVPSEHVFVPQALSAIEARQQRHKHVEKQEQQVELGELCERACENWLDHQFIVPVSYDDQTEAMQEMVDEIIEIQRQSNEEGCITGCKKAADRIRAQCVASAPSILDIDDCRL